MNKSASTPAKKTPPGSDVVILLTPDPLPPWLCNRGEAADPAMFTPAVTHGCVDWFNYESHPLQPARPQR